MFFFLPVVSDFQFECLPLDINQISGEKPEFLRATRQSATASISERFFAIVYFPKERQTRIFAQEKRTKLVSKCAAFCAIMESIC